MNPYAGVDDLVYGANDMVVFTARGPYTENGQVYFDHPKNTTYGVGSRATGVIPLRKYRVGTPLWE